MPEIAAIRAGDYSPSMSDAMIAARFGACDRLRIEASHGSPGPQAHVLLESWHKKCENIITFSNSRGPFLYLQRKSGSQSQVRANRFCLCIKVMYLVEACGKTIFADRKSKRGRSGSQIYLQEDTL